MQKLSVPNVASNESVMSKITRCMYSYVASGGRKEISPETFENTIVLVSKDSLGMIPTIKRSVYGERDGGSR